MKKTIAILLTAWTRKKAQLYMCMLWHIHSISQLYFPKLFTNNLPT